MEGRRITSFASTSRLFFGWGQDEMLYVDLISV